MADRGTFARGLTIGAIAGLTVGLLAAPRTGRENRRTLEKSARALPEIGADLASSLQLQAGRVVGLTCGRWRGTTRRLQQSIAAGWVATQQEMRGAASETTAREAANMRRRS